MRGPLVDAVVVQSAPLVRTLQFSARVATLSRVDVGSTLTGRVAQVRVAEGAQVRQGDVLVQLESDELRAALAQAVASERQAQARLTGLRSSGRTAAQAASAQASATLQAANASLARVQQLVAEGFYSPAQLDEARRAVDVARAQQLSAQAQMQANADAGTDVAQAQAQLALAQAATVAAQARLAQTALVAPADARVLVRAVEPGQIVQPGKALLSLALAGPTQLVAQVDERFLDQLEPGQKAAVVADAFAGQRFAARVLSIAPAVDAQRGAIEVKFALEQLAPAYLREDMTLSVEVETARRESALVLPQATLRGAMAGDTGAVLVLVLQDGRAEARAVRLGLRTLDAVEVLEGLTGGDTVLRGGAVQAGDRVRARTVPWMAGTAAPATGAGAKGRADAASGAAPSGTKGR
ncbi:MULTISPECIES: efflux RND transporter periplasmic adaptor subunit [unclassified Acidovorax]|uniref:efflux RND transporter periplasmic adaptor subunit n=1 Tax=unclassified Acidovorax TaxID=2684926 RepID=UPI0025C674FB|nr:MULTISPECIES: efflux RND transporter periplasmic adaptor subunit [unclassified Acidovorax]HQS20191.1 efflux RND transporter periplasmic adaptor subunit [Acidovorax defluvii]HQS63521.1 efflux RND transporter periplasmic adaptor subunit [Acidovorax defluvii]HQT17207.1 efflux RND transporter periplasmic adaptor subunit [Acidovorax defluvii]HQT49332.1 efflux RND transporter periplasmic adaptor subunit [Acidovorax defluvii]